MIDKFQDTESTETQFYPLMGGLGLLFLMLLVKFVNRERRFMKEFMLKNTVSEN
jgi:hypothetical protein